MIRSMWGLVLLKLRSNSKCQLDLSLNLDMRGQVGHFHV